METEEFEALKAQLIDFAEFENLKWLDLRFFDEEPGRSAALLRMRLSSTT